MSRLPDNPSPKGERGEKGFGEETVGDLVSANTSQGLVCPSSHGHPDCQGHPILEPDELWVHFHPVQELRKWLLCWSSHLLCSLGAISPALFLDVLKSQRLADHFKIYTGLRGRIDAYWKSLGLFSFLLNLCLNYLIRKVGIYPQKNFVGIAMMNIASILELTQVYNFLFIYSLSASKGIWVDLLKRRNNIIKQPSFFSLNIFNWSSFSQLLSQWGCVHFLFSRIPY